MRVLAAGAVWWLLLWGWSAFADDDSPQCVIGEDEDGCETQHDCFARQHCNAQTGCCDCAACGSESYILSCTWRGVSSCQACSTCPAGAYTNVACYLSTDTDCQPCATCAPEGYVSSVCQAGSRTSAGANTQCSACTVCSGTQRTIALCVAGSYLSLGRDTQCGSCTSCTSGTYTSNVCSLGSPTVLGTDTTCTPCTTCAAGSYQFAACQTGTLAQQGYDTVCTRCQHCGMGEYQIANCTALADYSCSWCSFPCGSAEYITRLCDGTTAASAPTFQTCATCSTCPAAHYVIMTCGPGALAALGHDTVCNSCSGCRAGEFIAQSCQGGSATVLGTNTVCSGCQGGLAFNCSWGYRRADQGSPCTGGGSVDTQLCTACNGNGASYTCPARQFRSGTQCSGVTTTDTQTCMPCSVCGPGSWAQEACTLTHDTVCTECSHCAAGSYQAEACETYAEGSATGVDTVCQLCMRCSTGAFVIDACQPNPLWYLEGNDTVCQDCRVCDPHAYATVACAGSADTVCTQCTGCAPGSYLVQGCTPGRGGGLGLNTVCAQCSTCGAGNFTFVPCVGTTGDAVVDPGQDTQCAGCSLLCPLGYYETLPCQPGSSLIVGADITCGVNACTLHPGGCLPDSVCLPNAAHVPQCVCNAGYSQIGINGACIGDQCSPLTEPVEHGFAGSCAEPTVHGLPCQLTCEAGYFYEGAPILCWAGTLQHEAGLACVPAQPAASSGDETLLVTASAGSVGLVMLLLVAFCWFRRRTSRTLINLQMQEQVMDAWRVIDLKELTLGEVIGVGSTATVYSATWHGSEVAVKKMNPQTSAADFARETNISRALPQHPRVVRFFGACTTAPQLCIVLAQMVFGSVEDVVVRNNAYPIDPRVLLRGGGGGGGGLDTASAFNASSSARADTLLRHLRVLVQIAVDASAGLLHCHMNNVVHRDVRAANVLLTREHGQGGGGGMPAMQGQGQPVDTDQVRATICDFGLSRYLEKGWAHGGSQSKGVAPSDDRLPLMWCAPESRLDRTYSVEADCFSFGIFLWELVARSIPFPDYTMEEFKHLEQDELLVMRPVLPATTPSKFLALIRACWHSNPHKRPSMAQCNKELSAFLHECEACAPQTAAVLALFDASAFDEQLDPRNEGEGAVPPTGSAGTTPSTASEVHPGAHPRVLLASPAAAYESLGNTPARRKRSVFEIT